MYQMTHVWRQSAGKRAPILQICGLDTVGKRAIALHICQQLELKLYSLNSKINFSDINQFHQLQRLCEREYVLGNCALFIDCDFGDEPSCDSHIWQLVDTIACPVIISSRQRRQQMHTPVVSFEVPMPSSKEQYQLWENCMGDRLNGFAAELVSHFHLSPSSIRSACLRADPNAIEASLWSACRLQARPPLDELAQRISPPISKVTLIRLFLRRLRFVVQFPFPDATQRMEIWRRAFPPTQNLDFAKLAKLNIGGGNIRNIALNAAFMAADTRADEAYSGIC
jgi:hypothetical protein